MRASDFNWLATNDFHHDAACLDIIHHASPLKSSAMLAEDRNSCLLQQSFGHCQIQGTDSVNSSGIEHVCTTSQFGDKLSCLSPGSFDTAEQFRNGSVCIFSGLTTISVGGGQNNVSKSSDRFFRVMQNKSDAGAE